MASGVSPTREEQVQPEGKEAGKPKKKGAGLITMLKIDQLKTKRMPWSQAEHRRCRIKMTKDFPFRIQINRTWTYRTVATTMIGPLWTPDTWRHKPRVGQKISHLPRSIPPPRVQLITPTAASQRRHWKLTNYPKPLKPKRTRTWPMVNPVAVKPGNLEPLQQKVILKLMKV